MAKQFGLRPQAKTLPERPLAAPLPERPLESALPERSLESAPPEWPLESALPERPQVPAPSKRPPDNVDFSNNFFWGATRHGPRKPRICHSRPRPLIHHGCLSPLIRHGRSPHPPSHWMLYGAGRACYRGGNVRPVSPCLVSPFLLCPYMVLPVSYSLLVQLVPAVCLDYVPVMSS